jgi:hypothetical protein
MKIVLGELQPAPLFLKDQMKAPDQPTCMRFASIRRQIRRADGFVLGCSEKRLDAVGYLPAGTYKSERIGEDEAH